MAGDFVELTDNSSETTPANLFGIAIGKISFRFLGMDDEFYASSKGTYKYFLSKDNHPSHFANVCSAGGMGNLPENDFRIGFNEGSRQYFIQAPYFMGTADEAFAKGSLAMFLCPNDNYKELALENYIRWITANLALIKTEGFMLHSSASVIDGSAHVFFGPHGSGKSTAVSFIRNGFPIADDALLLIQKEGKFYAAAMPAVHKFKQKIENVGYFPVKGFYRLIKSDKNKLESLNKTAALAQLIASAPFLKETKEYEQKLFATAMKTIENVPVFNLYFKKEEHFLEEAFNAMKIGK
jgi:hypothetical protein